MDQQNFPVDALYQFDPSLRVEELDGLEKLRAVPDRRTAQWLLVLWDVVGRNERSPAFARREEARAKRRAAQERERQLAVAAEARKGVFGFTGQELWKTYTNGGADMSPTALAELVENLRGVPRQ